MRRHSTLSINQRLPRLVFAQELLPDFRPVVEAYFEAMLELGRRLMRLLALCLDLPPTWCADSARSTPASYTVYPLTIRHPTAHASDGNSASPEAHL